MGALHHLRTLIPAPIIGIEWTWYSGTQVSFMGGSEDHRALVAVNFRGLPAEAPTRIACMHDGRLAGRSLTLKELKA